MIAGLFIPQIDATQVQYVDKVVDVPVVETSQLDGDAHDDVVRRMENAIRECMEATEALQEKVQAVSREVDVRKLVRSSGRNECSTEEGEMGSRLGVHASKKMDTLQRKKTGLFRQGPKEQLIEIGGADGACEEKATSEYFASLTQPIT